MKKRHPLLFINLLVLLLSVACNLGGNSRTVSIDDGIASIKIEYKGEVLFNADGTTIDEISPSGYVKYSNNDKKLIARPNKSGIVDYKLYFGDSRQDMNNAATKEFFKTAMSAIAGHYER